MGADGAYVAAQHCISVASGSKITGMQTQTDTTVDSALEFPCFFPIKAMGLADDGFSALVVEIVRRHAPEVDESTVSAKLSRGGRYISVTVSITAESRSQLDAIYRDLTGHERILTVL